MNNYFEKKSVPTRFVNHLKRQKVAYVSTALLIGTVCIIKRNNESFEKFLIEKGIDPLEYWLNDVQL